MATGGEAGDLPDEYLLIRAARYLGVAPWELARQPLCWTHWGLTFELADRRAREIAEKIAAQREGLQNGQAGDDGPEEAVDDAAWRADLLRQIEAQGGVIGREDDGE